MGRPLGPRGGRDPGGGGTGLPEGLSGGRAARWRSGAVGAAASGGAWAAGAGAEGAWAAGATGVAGAAGAAGAAGDWAGCGAGDCAGETAGAAGGAAGGVGRLLLIRRGDRAAGRSGATGAEGAVGAVGPAGAGGAAAVPEPAAAGADTGRAGALLTGPALGAALLDTEVSGRRAGASPVPPPSVPEVGEADFAAFAAFLAGAGSSGWTGRRKPSASALRRTRSASASSIEDEWLLTPMPRERANSSPSLLVRPSSLASS